MHPPPCRIADYRALYAAGETPARVLGALRERIAAHDDPGIFLHLASAAALDRLATALGPRGPRPAAAVGRADGGEGQHRRGGHAHHRRLPRLRLRAAAARHRGRAPGRRRSRAHRQDQPRPVRHRPERHPHAPPGAAQPARAGARAGRLVVGLGGGGGIGAGAGGAGHGHGGLGAGAGGAVRLGGAQAHAGCGVHARPGAGLPLARLRQRVRARRGGGLGGARRAGRPGRRGPVLARPAARRPGHGRTRPHARHSRRGRPPPLRPAGGARLGACLDRLAALGLQLVPVPMHAFDEVAALLYEGAWVAERLATLEPFLAAAAPDAVLPVIRGIIEGSGRRHTAADAFRAMHRLAGLRRELEPVWSRIDALAVPTAPLFPTLAEMAADPVGPNARLGRFTNFVNLLGLAALAVPGPDRPDGLPAGVTVIGPGGSDARLAALGLRIEAAA